MRCCRAMRSPRRTAGDKQTSLEQLRAICRKQSGAVHRSQVLDAGFTLHELQGLVARGALTPALRWTFTLPGTGTALQTRSWCGVLSAGQGAMVTGAKALALMGALPERTGPIECLRSRGRPRPQPGLVVRTAPDLADREAHTVDGIPVTTFARSVLEFAANGRADDVDRALDSGARLRLFNGLDFEQLRLALPDHRGLPALESALAQLDENTGRKRSELERRLVSLLTSADLPPLVVNGTVHGHEVDLHRPGSRGII